MIHIGSEIEKVIKTKGISVSKFANSINKSRTVVYNIFKRESIDSKLLYTISKVLECNFFNYYFENSIHSKPISSKDNWRMKYYKLLEKHSNLLEKVLKD